MQKHNNCVFYIGKINYIYNNNKGINICVFYTGKTNYIDNKINKRIKMYGRAIEQPSTNYIGFEPILLG